jgi:GTP 3',8-cyclase
VDDSKGPARPLRTPHRLPAPVGHRPLRHALWLLHAQGFSGFAEPDDWLTFAEIERVVRAFTELGVHRVRLTGGEPLVRRKLPDLAARLAALPGLEDLSLSSNCSRMEKLARPLYEAGVRRLNVSLDSLRPEVFQRITAGRLDKVLRGIDAAQRAGLAPIRVNTVVMRGVNEDEIEDILAYCAARGLTLRLIETMPMGSTGQAAVDQYVDLQADQASSRVAVRADPGRAPRRRPGALFPGCRQRDPDRLITPMSQHFCATCNRVRLTVEGRLHMCLGQEHSYPLRELLRDGAGVEESEGPPAPCHRAEAGASRVPRQAVAGGALHVDDRG